MDYGCGHGADVKFLQDVVDNVNGYDPYWAPNSLLLRRQYSVVLCTYVLNVLDTDERYLVLGKLKKLTNSLGSIFITVRRDFKKDYVTKKGTRQYVVELPYIKIKENSQFCIYETSGIGRMR